MILATILAQAVALAVLVGAVTALPLMIHDVLAVRAADLDTTDPID